MVPRLSRRRALQLAGSSTVVALAGCTNAVGYSRIEADSSLGTTDYDPVLTEQPTVEDGVPAAWGMLFGHPDSARKLIDWRTLVSQDSTIEPGTEFRSFNPDTQFMSVVVGILPTGYGLTSYEEDPDSILEDIVADFRDRPTVQDGTLRFEVTPYRAFTPEDDDPPAHYDYTFTLWNLNGQDRPAEIEITLRTE